MKRLTLVALVLSFLLTAPPMHGQMRLLPVTDQQGELALALELRKLRNVGTLMMTTAHPDDENNGMLAWATHGLGMRAALVSATRGDGGQNEIGPELFDALAVLRTEELAAAHRFDGAEQYFTRAVDFGYSFSVEETKQKWGEQEILGDFVRLIRAIRPDVIVGFIWEGTGGGQHHQTTARLTAEAFRAAADPAKFPEHLREGLRPWQAKKYYATASMGFRGEAAPPAGVKLLTADSNVYDALLGRTYAEIGTEARSMHKCQGMSQLLQLPGASSTRRYRLIDTTLAGQKEKDESSVFDGVDSGLAALSSFAGANPPARLTSGLSDISRQIDAAERALGTSGPSAAAAPLASGLTATRRLRADLGAVGLPDDAAFEIAFRLDRKITQFERALALAHGLVTDALADDGLVVGGQKVGLSVVAVARESAGAEVKSVLVSGFQPGVPPCPAGATAASKAYECRLDVVVPADARLTTPHFRRLPDAARYAFDADVPFGLPFRPTPFRVAIQVVLSGVDVTLEVPVKHRYEGSVLSGEKRMELHVVPAFAARVTPEIAIVARGGATTRPTAAAADVPRRGREVRVTVTNGGKGATQAQVMLDVPPGWNAEPATQPVSFTREDEEATVRFTVTPGSQAAPGDYRVTARVRHAEAAFDRGIEVIEYPHTTRRHVVRPAEVVVKVLDVKTAPGLRVGYIAGVGDEVPAALAQIGATVEFVDSDTLAWGDLSRFDTIVTGVRAYERRADLRANNHRLIEYAERGGTVLVQYNKFEFNEAQYGPYPAKVSSSRVTDEHAPVRVLVPGHPVFGYPNRIGEDAWKHWVQERGLYFLGERDSRYVDLVESEETFEFNKGVKRGALVEARVGKGRWIYIGLGLWRQLPAGTDGAYLLMANLVSLGKAPVAKTTAPAP